MRNVEIVTMENGYYLKEDPSKYSRLGYVFETAEKLAEFLIKNLDKPGPTKVDSDHGKFISTAMAGEELRTGDAVGLYATDNGTVVRKHR